MLISSIVRGFGDEFEQHFNRGCQSCRDVIVPKMVDFDPSKASFGYSRTKRGD